MQPFRTTAMPMRVAAKNHAGAAIGETT